MNKAILGKKESGKCFEKERNQGNKVSIDRGEGLVYLDRVSRQGSAKNDICA